MEGRGSSAATRSFYMSAQDGTQPLMLVGQYCTVPTKRPATSQLTLSGAMLSDEWVGLSSPKTLCL